MSWSIKSIGLRAAVKADVLKSNMPDGLKDTIVAMLDKPAPVCSYDSARVESWGHYDPTTGGNIGKCEVELFNAAVLPVNPLIPPATTLSAIEQVEYDAGRALALEGKQQPDDASEAAKRGYASVPPFKANPDIIDPVPTVGPADATSV